MKAMTKAEAWDHVRGMTLVWDYCKDGTAACNATGVQSWFLRTERGCPSLKVCRGIAAEIRRSARNPFGRGVGDGAGQIRFC